MMKLLRFTRNAWIAFFVSLIASFLMASITHAQESPEAIAKKYGITFPIAEFNNCQDYASCHAFCEDPVNSAVCKAYFKAKGVYQEDASEEEVVSAARSELGCDSASSCEAFCQKEENHDKCDAFVGKHKDKLGVKGGYVKDPQEIAEKAKEVLGCNSKDACFAFCSKDENRQKCDEFASQVGARGGIERKGPGGCSSKETCSAYCSDPNNFSECSKAGSASAGSNFKGPGGCNSEESCRSYCEQNPQSCKIVAVAGSGLIDPSKAAEEYKRYCQANPTKCAAQSANPFSSSVGRAEFERFCEANPEKCSSGHEEEFRQARKAEYERACKNNPNKCQIGPGGYFIPKEIIGGGGYVDPGDYCKKYPERCAGGSNYNPEAMCKQTPNCKWENNNCRCESGGNYSPQPWSSNQPYPSYSAQPNYTPEPYPSYSPYTRPYATPSTNITTSTAPSGMSRDQQEAGCKSCGGTCNWNGDFCNCQCQQTTTTQPTQTSAPTQTQQQQTQTQTTQQTTSTTTQTTESSGGSSGGGCPSGSYMKDGVCVSGVQGVSTARNLLDRILDIFR